MSYAMVDAWMQLRLQHFNGRRLNAKHQCFTRVVRIKSDQIFALITVAHFIQSIPTIYSYA